jgi:PAS domain S-box-containing protein
MLRLSALAAAVLIPLLWSGLELRTEFARAKTLRAELNRSYATQSRIQSVFSLMQDAETGQRGYIITGRIEFLQPYQSARGQLNAELAELASLFAESPAQKQRLEALRSDVDAKLRELDRSIRIRREQGAEAGMAVVSTGRGRLIMDEIRSVVLQMTTAEAAALETRSLANAELTVRTERVIVLLFSFMVLSLAISGFLVWRTSGIRQRSLALVQAQAARQRAIFDSTLDAIITLNPSGSIESVNRAAETMFGYQFDELDRRDIAVLMLTSLARNGEGSFVERLVDSGIELKHGLVREAVARRRDGTTFPVDVALSEMHLEDGLHLVAAIRDISERKRIEQMKDEFVSTVSHELRTPLTSIAGSLGLLKAGAAGPVPDTAARLISIASNNVDRLVRLINDILDVEKIQSGQMPFDRAPSDLRGLVQKSVEGVLGYADQMRVSVAVTPGVSCMVEADGDRLVQVMTNLLSNAAKFSPAGGVVEVDITSTDHMARVAVRDHGPGVPDGFKDRIFSKFAQADSSDTRQKGGTGLGLAIAREIVERHGGRLHFTSTAGEGATFYVDLPLAGASLERAPVQPVMTNVALGSGSRPLIIHVEDDPDVGAVVAAALANIAEVVTVTSLAAARQALSQRAPDLIILDLGLPDGSGELLLPELDRGQRAVPVVLYSAQDVDRRIERKVAAALTKSRTSLDGLVATVQRLTTKAA